MQLSGPVCFTVVKQGRAKNQRITYDQQTIEGYFISDKDMKKGKQLVITTAL
jgi:hypothetical protein